MMVPRRFYSVLKAVVILALLYKFVSLLSGSLKSGKSIDQPQKEDTFRTEFTQLHRDFVNLKPKCGPLDKYLEDSQPYHQYYGYDDYDVKLDDEALAGLLYISKEQEKEVVRSNKLMMSYLQKGSKFMETFQKSLELSDLIRAPQGIVYVADEKLFWLTFLSIKYIRDVNKDKTPVQIFTPLASELCSKLARKFDQVQCSSFDEYLPTEVMTNFQKGYQYKSLALILSPFEDTLFLDSDNLLLAPATNLFTSPKYTSTGLVLWPDFWKRSTNPLYYKMINKFHLIKLLHINSTPAVESGEIVVNKKKHLRTLVLAYYYNIHGPDYFYPLFTQGFPGEGDKETFLMAAIALDEPYHFIQQKTQIAGYNEAVDDRFYGQAILQPDPTKAAEFVFLHCNYPKLKVWELNEKYFNHLTNPTQEHRSFQVVRNAKKDGDTPFIEVVGRDVELEVWTMMEKLADQLADFWEYIAVGPVDEARSKIKARIAFLQSQII